MKPPAAKGRGRIVLTLAHKFINFMKRREVWQEKKSGSAGTDFCTTYGEIRLHPALPVVIPEAPGMVKNRQ